MKISKEQKSRNVSVYSAPTTKTDREPAPRSFGDGLDKADRRKKARENTPSGKKQNLSKPKSSKEKELAFGVSEYVKDYIQGRDPRSDRSAAAPKYNREKR